MGKNLILSALIIAVFALTGCETSRGIGKDVENTGRNIQKTVDKND